MGRLQAGGQVHSEGARTAASLEGNAYRREFARARGWETGSCCHRYIPTAELRGQLHGGLRGLGDEG